MAKAIWRSRIPVVVDQLETQVVDKINVKAREYADLVKARLLTGYTTGAFVTGETAESITVELATPEEPVAVISSDSIVAIAWELGFVNLFTRKFERVEHWRDAAVELAARSI